eukprot:Transcript_16824.p2 GENE.Transcript_16824~~Transcript_16824.p2  ORF type:complete len:282 (-),score=64.63 Transcript_16824:300-1067(-)
MDTTAAAASPPPLRIFLSGDRFLVWEPRDIYSLRCQHRIMGCLVGALPSNKRQAAQLGPPLSLSFEEAVLATEQGFAEVVDCASASSADAAAASPASDRATAFCAIPTACAEWSAAPLPTLQPTELMRLAGTGRQAHVRVFRDLWERGWAITLGTKFGADYLVYPGDPMAHHAAHTVHVAPPERPLRPLEMVAAARLAHDAKKSAVLAHCTEHDEAVRSPGRASRSLSAAWALLLLALEHSALDARRGVPSRCAT